MEKELKTVLYTVLDDESVSEDTKNVVEDYIDKEFKDRAIRLYEEHVSGYGLYNDIDYDINKKVQFCYRMEFCTDLENFINEYWDRIEEIITIFGNLNLKEKLLSEAEKKEENE